MSAGAIIAIIAICVMVICSFLMNMIFFMMVEAIDRQRRGESLFSDFGYIRLRLLDVFREYRSSYPNGKLHVYGLAAFAVGLIGMVVLVSVGAYSLLLNQPVVRINFPSDGASFTAPANIIISADVREGDFRILRVDFYEEDTLIGSSTTLPYGITWSNVPAGSYSLTAKATDDQGTTATSDAVSITVNAPGNTVP